MDPNIQFNQNLGESLVDPGPYQQFIGIFIYLNVTRPDITFVVY